MSAKNAIDGIDFRLRVNKDYISSLLSFDDAFDSFIEFYRNVGNFDEFVYWPSRLTSGERTQEKLWQSFYGRWNTSFEEDSFSVCKRTVFVDFLKAKTTGEQISQARSTSAVLSIFLLPRWSAVSRRDMLLDAKFLLQRPLYYWEGIALIFLQNLVKRTISSRETESRSDTSFQLIKDTGIIPVNFIDIVDVLLKNGVCVNARNENNDDLMLTICRGYKVGADCADFFEFILQRGYDVERSGENLVRELCKSRYESKLSESKLRMLKKLFNAGLKLSDEAKRDLIPGFIIHALKGCMEKSDYCCYHGVLKRLHEGGYWTTIDLLWDAGAAINQTAENFLDALMNFLDHLRIFQSRRDGMICGDCFNICFNAACSMDEALTWLATVRFEEVFNFIGRLVRAVNLQDGPGGKYLDKPLRFVCENFAGEQLVNLFKVLCENGVNVNARFNAHRNGNNWRVNRAQVESSAPSIQINRYHETLRLRKVVRLHNLNSLPIVLSMKSCSTVSIRICIGKIPL